MEIDRCTLCGECKGCPAWIDIPGCIQIVRTRDKSEESLEKLDQIRNCIHCKRCTKKCPEQIQVFELMQEIYKNRNYLDDFNI